MKHINLHVYRYVIFINNDRHFVYKHNSIKSRLLSFSVTNDTFLLYSLVLRSVFVGFTTGKIGFSQNAAVRLLDFC